MSERRSIRAALTEDEYLALYRCVSGELESLTERDWDSGTADDLLAAQRALAAAWKRSRARRAQPRDVPQPKVVR